MHPACLRAMGMNAGDDARRRRVALLAAAIVLMSVTDLSLTLTHVRYMGMVELNPLAAALMRRGDPLLLTLWKLCTVSLSVLILLRISRFRAAEIGAWAGVAVMLGLMIHWTNYIAVSPLGAIDQPGVVTWVEADLAAFDPG